jgi:hypothetical protein
MHVTIFLFAKLHYILENNIEGVGWYIASSFEVKNNTILF